jgi:hypothetical protein
LLSKVAVSLLIDVLQIAGVQVIPPANHEVDALFVNRTIEVKLKLLHMSVKILGFFSSPYISVFQKNGGPLEAMQVTNEAIHLVASNINDKLV